MTLTGKLAVSAAGAAMSAALLIACGGGKPSPAPRPAQARDAHRMPDEGRRADPGATALPAPGFAYDEENLPSPVPTPGGPETQGPETQRPETQRPETQRPETQRPEIVYDQGWGSTS